MISDTKKWLGGLIPICEVTDLQNEVQALYEAFDVTANSTLISIANISNEVSARICRIEWRLTCCWLLKGAHDTCKVITSECCLYIKDGSGKVVHNLAKVLHKQIAKLNEDHGLFSSDWDTGFTSILGPLWNHLKAPFGSCNFRSVCHLALVHKSHKSVDLSY